MQTDHAIAVRFSVHSAPSTNPTLATVMVQGVLHRAKRYVSVIAVTDADGTMSPIDIGLDGRRYVVDEVLDARRARSMKCGGRGMRYTVRIGNAVTYLFFEDPRWFVEAKVYGELAGR